MLIKVSNINNLAINYTLIQQISFLLQNLENKQYIYYLFSNNFLNILLSKNFLFYNDDYFTLYVSFLKSLSLRITKETLSLLYQNNINHFPLVQYALKLYNSTEPMVVTSIRNVILNILKLEDSDVENHFLMLPSISYFSFLPCQLMDMALQIENKITKKESEDNIKSILENMYDLILYLNDILNLNKEKITYVLLNGLYYHFVMPLFSNISNSKSNQEVSVKVSLFILIILFTSIKNETFKNIFVTILLSDEISSNLIEYFAPQLKNDYYSFTLDKNKLRDETFGDFIIANYSTKFIKSICKEENIILNSKNFPEMKSLKVKFKEILKKYKNNENMQIQKVIEELNKILKREDLIEKKISYEQKISKILGIDIGFQKGGDVNTIKYSKCFMESMKQFFIQIKTTKELKKNDIKTGFLSLFDNGDRNIVFLVNLLLHNILTSSVNKKLLNYIGLGKNSEYSTNNNQIIQNEKNTNDFVFDNNFFGKVNLYRKINLQTNVILSKKIIKYFETNCQILQSQFLSLYFNNIFSLFSIEKEIEYSKIQKQQFLQKMFGQLLKNLNKEIMSNKNLRINGYGWFNDAWNSFSKNRINTEDNYVKELRNKITIKKILLKNPMLKEKTIYQNMLMVYLYFNDYLQKITENNNLLIKHFPLECDYHFFVGGTFLISDLLSENMSSYSIKYKIKEGNQFQSGIVFINENSFFLGIPTQNREKVTLQYKELNVNFHYYQSSEDDEDIILVHFKSLKEKITVVLKFESHEICEEFKSSLTENHLNLQNEEYLMFMNYFDNKLQEYEA